MKNKIDLAAIRAKFPQEWPRYTVGMIATVGLKRAIHTGSLLFTWETIFSGQYSELMTAAPPGVHRALQGTVGGIATVGIIANSLALRGAIKRNPRNIRTAFRMWAFTAVVLYMPGLLYFLVADGRLGMTDKEVTEFFVNGLALSSLDGWSMFVYMRDLKGQKRNSYGLLVKDKDKADPEKGPLDEQA
ncbi:hypothetical protein BGZ95_007328 [Linnemannia exigua]|uniref:Uncharacterized protein n=1 Tax=Linnemannia exigua TaxID=604196 RepID=A0AAD4H6X6_9FUNG|nr:hypothetical protein BGZ95_007328 [Linnemannia exigua]